MLCEQKYASIIRKMYLKHQVFKAEKCPPRVLYYYIVYHLVIITRALTCKQNFSLG